MQVENNRGDRYKFCQTDSECWEFRDDLIASHTGRQDPCPLRRRNWHLKSRENQPAILSSATSEFPQQGVLALSQAKGLRRRTPIRVKTRRGANLEVRVEQLGHWKKERTDERGRRVNAKAAMHATVWNCDDTAGSSLQFWIGIEFPTREMRADQPAMRATLPQSRGCARGTGHRPETGSAQ
jgi:hypothetical protein